MPVTAGSRAVVVGLDVGGTKTNATVLDDTGAFLIDRMTEAPSRVHEGPAAAIEAIGHAMDLALAMTGRSRDDVLAVGLDTPGPGERWRCHLGQGGHQLRRARVVGVRLPRRRRAFAAPPRHLQQRWQRRRVVRAPTTVRPRCGAALVDLGDRRHRTRWRGDRIRRGRARRLRHGRRVGPRPHPDGRSARRSDSRSRAATAGSWATSRASPR